MKVVWTPLALDDLNDAREYIAAENPSAAPHVIGRIKAAVKALRAHPNIGRQGRVEGTRELVVAGTPFVIPYRVRRNRVEILALIHGARRWPESF